MLLCAQAEKLLTDDWVYPLNFSFFPRVFHFFPMSFSFLPQYLSSIFKIYRAVLSKCEIFIKMRVAESRPSFDIEKSLFNKNPLFLIKITSYFITWSLKCLFSLTFEITHIFSSIWEISMRSRVAEKERKKMFDVCTCQAILIILLLTFCFNLKSYT